MAGSRSTATDGGDPTDVGAEDDVADDGSDSESELGPGQFRPPAAFVHASLARQARIKKQQAAREAAASPAPVKAGGSKGHRPGSPHTATHSNDGPAKRIANSITTDGSPSTTKKPKGRPAADGKVKPRAGSNTSASGSTADVTAPARTKVLAKSRSGGSVLSDPSPRAEQRHADRPPAPGSQSNVRKSPTTPLGVRGSSTSLLELTMQAPTGRPPEGLFQRGTSSPALGGHSIRTGHLNATSGRCETPEPRSAPEIMDGRLMDAGEPGEEVDGGPLFGPTPSKTVMEVSRLKAAREERRALAAEIKKAADEMDEHDKEFKVYRDAIEEFRVSLGWDQANTAAVKAEAGESVNRDDENGKAKIRVCVRKRPMNAKEIAKRHFDIATVRTASYPDASIYIHEPKVRVNMSKFIDTHEFFLDNAFDEHATNAEVYATIAAPLVDSVFNGGMCTFFAYGQTGSGKTHTIFGNPREQGIYDHASLDLFHHLSAHNLSNPTRRAHLRVCFFEIYGPKVRDLLSSRSRVQLLEDHGGTVRVVGLREADVRTAAELSVLAREGQACRARGATEANPESSRSHAVLQISLVEQFMDGSEGGGAAGRAGSRNKAGKADKGGVVATGGGIVVGKLSLVDLAGSERGADVGQVGRQSRVEGSEINKSLLALKECIRALHRRDAPAGAAAGDHIPFRGSKLTQILRDSFIGSRSTTVMIATVSPGSNSAEHTLNTIRYADRVKELKRGSGVGAVAASGRKADAGVGGGSAVKQQPRVASRQQVARATPSDAPPIYAASESGGSNAEEGTFMDHEVEGPRSSSDTDDSSEGDAYARRVAPYPPPAASAGPWSARALPMDNGSGPWAGRAFPSDDGGSSCDEETERGLRQPDSLRSKDDQLRLRAASNGSAWSEAASEQGAALYSSASSENLFRTRQPSHPVMGDTSSSSSSSSSSSLSSTASSRASMRNTVVGTTAADRGKQESPLRLPPISSSSTGSMRSSVASRGSLVNATASVDALADATASEPHSLERRVRALEAELMEERMAHQATLRQLQAALTGRRGMSAPDVSEEIGNFWGT
ncbi:Kinesin-like protein kif2a [Irineochytrium annulatum]|nr:Kinesin-like protein kif2a [Irineochytrium annulatum]